LNENSKEVFRLETKVKGSRWVWLAVGILLIISLLIALPACSGTTEEITEAGSTTVQPLAEQFAEAFKVTHPDVVVTIQGGGSSVGVKSAADGTVDIGAASREIKPDEPELVKHLIAKDGIAIIVHPSNEISDIDKDKVKEIFSGNITNWSDIGGPDEQITVVAREEGSGTRGAFEEMVMDEELITNTAILQSSNGALRTTVANDPNAIGFLSLGYVDNMVKALSINGIPCSTATALDGTYPIVRPLYFLTATEPTGLVKEFLDFCTGIEGQTIVEEEGYIPVK
jgi:phosphate transport system substrate-binding protein